MFGHKLEKAEERSEFLRALSRPRNAAIASNYFKSMFAQVFAYELASPSFRLLPLPLPTDVQPYNGMPLEQKWR